MFTCVDRFGTSGSFKVYNQNFGARNKQGLGINTFIFRQLSLKNQVQIICPDFVFMTGIFPRAVVTCKYSFTNTLMATGSIPFSSRFYFFNYFFRNRPLSFILLSHGDNQSVNYEVLQLLLADVGGNVLTLSSCVLRSEWTESVWMPVAFPVHSIRSLRKRLRHLAGRCHYFFFLITLKKIQVSRVGGGGFCPHLRSTCALSAYACVLGGGGGCVRACVTLWVCVCVCARARARVSACVSA